MISRIASIIALCVLLCDARKLYGGMESWSYQNEIEQDGAARTKEHKSVEFLTRLIGFNYDRDTQLSRSRISEDLSPALMARYVVNQADWGALATISTRKDVPSYPVANLLAIADGPVGNGTGVPYMYLTPLDFPAQDLAEDHRATLLVSLAQGNYCKDKEYDPMDPRCARVMLTGKVVTLKNETKEHDIAKQLFFGRHPKLEKMPSSHHFFFAELEISAIALLDAFGGAKYISIKDYYSPTTRENFPRKKITSPFVSVF